MSDETTSIRDCVNQIIDKIEDHRINELYHLQVKKLRSEEKDLLLECDEQIRLSRKYRKDLQLFLFRFISDLDDWEVILLASTIKDIEAASEKWIAETTPESDKTIE